jgi:aspartate oxidase
LPALLLRPRLAQRAIERTVTNGPTDAILDNGPSAQHGILPSIEAALSGAAPAEAPRLDRARLQSLMWDDVGIVRSAESLERARVTLSAWAASLPEGSDRPSHELANLLLAGRLVA